MPTPPRMSKRSARGTTLILVLVIILFMITLAVSFLRGMGLQRDLAEGLRRNSILDSALFSAKGQAVQEIESFYLSESPPNGTDLEAFNLFFNDTAVPERPGPLGDPADADYEEKNKTDIWTWDPGLWDNVPEDYRVHQTDARWHEHQYLDTRYREVELKDDARYVVRYAYAVMDLSGRLQVNLGMRGATPADRYVFNAGTGVWEPQFRSQNINEVGGQTINISGSQGTFYDENDEPQMSTIQFAARHLARGLQFYEGTGFTKGQSRRGTGLNLLPKADIEAGFLSKGEIVRRMSMRIDYPKDWPADYTNDLFNWSQIRAVLDQKGTASEQPAYGLSAVSLDSWANVIASLYTPFGQADVVTADLATGDSDENYQWTPNINTAPPATIRAMIAAIDACLNFEARYMEPGSAAQNRSPRAALQLNEKVEADPTATPPVEFIRASVGTAVHYYPLNPNYDFQPHLVRAYNGGSLPVGDPDAPATVQLTSAQQAALFENVEIGDNFATITVINPDGIGINTIANHLLHIAGDPANDRPTFTAGYKTDLKNALTYQNIVHWNWAWRDKGDGTYEWVRLLDLGIGGPINTASYIDPRIEALLDGNEWGLRLGRRRSRHHRAVIRAEVFDLVENAAVQARVQEFVLHVDPNEDGNPNDSYFVYHVDRGRGLEGEFKVLKEVEYTPDCTVNASGNTSDKERVLTSVSSWRVTGPGWIEVDFGEVKDISRIKVAIKNNGRDQSHGLYEISVDGLFVGSGTPGSGAAYASGSLEFSVTASGQRVRVSRATNLEVVQIQVWGTVEETVQ